MTAANHALTGAFVATAIKQPVLAVPVAFLSHFVCDAIPHFDVKFKFGEKSMFLYLLGDGLVALLFAAFLLSQGVKNPVLLAACGFAAMSPDLMWLYYGLRDGTHSKKDHQGKLAHFHSWIQWRTGKSEIIIEIIWASLMIFGILKLQ